MKPITLGTCVRDVQEHVLTSHKMNKTTMVSGNICPAKNPNGFHGFLTFQGQEVWLEERETQLRMEEFSEQLSLGGSPGISYGPIANNVGRCR